jgi:hypothetical protein
MRGVMKSFPSLIVILMMALSLNACGYTRKMSLPRDIKTIHVDTVINKLDVRELTVYESGLEMRITNAIIDRLQKDGNLRVVGRDEADVVLECKLVDLKQEGVRFDSLEQVEEYQMLIVLDVTLKDAKTGDKFWQEPYLSGDAEYYVSTVRSIARGDAIVRAIDNLAHNVVDRIVEDW